MRQISLRLSALAGILVLNMELYMIMLALVRIGQAWQLNASSLQWLISIYYLFLAASMVIAGELTDKFHSIRVMTYSLVFYLALSLLAACSINFPMLLVIRCLQGIVAALLFNSSISTLLNSFEQTHKIKAMSLAVATVAIASAAGPFIAAGVLALFPWRMIFIVNGVVIILGLIAFWIAKPSIPIVKSKVPIKIKEGLFFASAALLIIYGITQISPFEPLWKGLTPIALGIIVLAWFLKRELSAEDPLLDIDLLRYRPCLIANTARFYIQGLAFFYFFALSLLLQINFSLSHFTTAYIFVGLALSQFIASIIIKKLIKHFSYKILIMICLGLISVSCFSLATPEFSNHLALLVFPNIIIAVCIGMMLALLTTYVVLHVEPERVGKANALIYTFAFSGASTLMALLSVVMAFYADRYLQKIAPILKQFNLTAAQHQGLLHLSIGGSLKESHLAESFPKNDLSSLIQLAHKAFFTAYHGAMFWLGVASVALLLLSTFIKKAA